MAVPRRISRGGVVAAMALVAGLVGASPATAQAPAPLPSLPGLPHGDVGLYWVRGPRPAAESRGLAGIWRAPGLPAALTVRGAALQASEGPSIVIGGVQAAVRLGVGAGLEWTWTAAVEAAVGEGTTLALPVGLVASRPWSAGSVWIAPYAGPRLGMGHSFDPGRDEDETTVSLLGDAGLDLSLDRGRRVVVRAASTVGTGQPSLALGASVRLH